MRESDKEQFAQWLTERLNPDYEYKFKRQEIDNDDFRDAVPQGDINERYADFKEFSKTDNYKNTILAQNLLSDSFDVSSTQLVKALETKYRLNPQECRSVLSNLNNNRNVEIHKNSYSGEWLIRRKK